MTQPTQIPTSTGMSALRITTTQIEHITISTEDTVTAIQQGIGCHFFDVVSLEDNIDLYVDDEGLINGSEFNLFLTIIAHTLGRPAAIFGTAIALSVDPDTGDTHPLTPEQITRITSAISENPSPAIVDQLCDTLAPMPNVVAYLRSL